MGHVGGSLALQNFPASGSWRGGFLRLAVCLKQENKADSSRDTVITVKVSYLKRE